MVILLRRLRPARPQVAINLKPRPAPWGGGNQVVEQIQNYLRQRGYGVTYRLQPGVAAILLVEPRANENDVQFGVAEIQAFKRRYPQVRCVHRINECDKRKGTTGVDELLRRANRATADMTVFISAWLRDYFVERWFDPAWPHQVIQNGADPALFYPTHKPIDTGGRTFRLVTHHWSDNWMKGFKVYQAVDRMIAGGELEDMSLMVIGRWPPEIRWQAAITHPPVRGKTLADLLRQNDLYLTASLWEPCGMHHIEGAQCGLPLVYHRDGGGIVEFGQRYGLGFREDVRPVLLQARAQYAALRRQVLSRPPSGATMCQLYGAALLE